MHRPSKWQSVLLALSMLLLSYSLSAVAQPQTMGTSITFASAGVGDDDPLEIEAMRQTYNLQLLFALKGSGEFLADVTVRIYNQAAANVLTAQATGPYFLALFALADDETRSCRHCQQGRGFVVPPLARSRVRNQPR